MISPQLPVEVLPEQNLISVSGPSLYVEQLREAMVAFEAAQGGRTVMRVFPLRYAWAEDMSVNSMDSVITIPGVASILRAMVSGTPLTGSSVSVLPSAQESLRGQGLASVGAVAPDPAAPSQPAPAAQGGGQQGGQAAEHHCGSARQLRAGDGRRISHELLCQGHCGSGQACGTGGNPCRDCGYRQRVFPRTGSELVRSGERRGEYVHRGQRRRSCGRRNLSFCGASSDGGLSFSTLYAHGTDYFLARVNALEEDGQARVLGKPSVLTMDNVQATLENTSTYYIPVQGYESSDLFRVDPEPFSR